MKDSILRVRQRRNTRIKLFGASDLIIIAVFAIQIIRLVK